MTEKADVQIEVSAHRFLETHRKMVLTVLDENGHPNSSLMLYAIDDGFNIYFCTCMGFGKYQALTSNPHVSLAVVQESIDPLQVVDMYGIAHEIDGEDTDKMYEWFTKKNPSKLYIKNAEDFVMFKIEPKGVRWLDGTFGELKIYDIGVS